MRTIILNSTNIVPTTNNSRLTYRFPTGGIKLEADDEIALTNLNVFYSWFNFDQALYNNTVFTYTWIDATTHTVTVPNSNLNITDLNAYLRSVMVTNKHYMLDGADIVVFLELLLNVSKYSVQYNALTVPTTAEAATLGWTLPAGATWTLPVSAITPQLTILSTNNFGTVIGFNAGTYPAAPSATNYSKLSDQAPQVSPITSMVVTCSLIDNDIANPSELLYCFPIPDVAFGTLITPSIPEFAFIQAKVGGFSTITVEFRDQLFNKVSIQDPQIVVILGLRKRQERLGK